MRRTFLCLILLMMLIALPAQAQEEDLTPYEIALQRIEEARPNRDGLGLERLRLTELPPELWELTELEYLDLRYNNISYLPPEIGQLANLQQLILAGNQLTSLPPEIGQLSNLRILDLVGNNISNLPSEIGQLENLEDLNLLDNQLSNLPEEIGQLSNLWVLSLGDNQLTSLPEEIGQLSKLCYLTIQNNNLSHLPNELGNITLLANPDCRLHLDGNPLISPPPEVIAEGTPAILAYLRNQAWWHLQRLIIGAASSIGLLAAVFLGLRMRQKRMMRKSKEKSRS